MGARQTDKVLDYLTEHGSITTREAVIELSIMSLPKRIEELRRAGHSIVTEYRRSTSGARYGVYKLEGK